MNHSILRLVAIVLGFIACHGALAQNCATISDDAERLQCYDRQAGRADSESNDDDEDEFVLLPQPPSFRVMVKGDSDPITTASDAEADPAEVSWARRDGENFVDANVAVVWQGALPGRFRETTSYFGSLLWSRSDTEEERSDRRKATVGLHYLSQFDSGVDNPWWMAVTTTGSAGHDIGKEQGSRAFKAEIDFGRKSWLLGRWQFIPTFGLRYDEIDPESGDGSAYSTGYLIGRASWTPFENHPQLKALATVGYVDDFDTDGDVVQRDGDFGALGLRYLLYRPAEEPRWMPELRLVRAFGVNPLDPDAPSNETRLTLAVSFDSNR